MAHPLLERSRFNHASILYLGSYWSKASVEVPGLVIWF